ncbi:hypothetical protein BDR26DRAFT_874078 [Obelidium mucronatum]|nr:hypothetical protein BDR26DRAFT_874078 [Obelidium mucronatum]
MDSGVKSFVAHIVPARKESLIAAYPKIDTTRILHHGNQRVRGKASASSALLETYADIMNEISDLPQRKLSDSALHLEYLLRKFSTIRSQSSRSTVTSSSATSELVLSPNTPSTPSLLASSASSIKSPKTPIKSRAILPLPATIVPEEQDPRSDSRKKIPRNSRPRNFRVFEIPQQRSDSLDLKLNELEDDDLTPDDYSFTEGSDKQDFVVRRVTRVLTIRGKKVASVHVQIGEVVEEGLLKKLQGLFSSHRK